MLDLGLVDPASRDLNGSSMEHVLAEFNHDELYQFFQKLETIQEQLDALQ